MTSKVARVFATSGMSVRSIVRYLVALAVIAGTVAASSELYSYQTSRTIESNWRELRANSDERLRAIETVTDTIGYGGLVHEFKNYAIRKDPAAREKLVNRIGAAEQALDQLAAVSETAFETVLVANLRYLVNSYGERVSMVSDLIRTGASARQIDDAVRLEDTRGREAIAHLIQRMVPSASDGQGIRLVAAIRLNSALGFGGMIHDFKNFVLRGGHENAARAASSVARARGEVAAYRSLDLSDTEAAAINTIDRTISEYSGHLGTIAERHNQGVPVEKIDAEVRVNDAPALAALDILDRAIAQRSAAMMRDIGERIDASERISLASLALTSILSLVLAGLIYGVLVHGVVRPAERVSAGLKRVADGDNSVDLRDLESETEIGQIASAAEVFRERSEELVGLQRQLLGDVEARTTSIVAAAANAILSTDEDGLIVTANPAAARMFGCVADSMIGCPLSSLFVDTIAEGGVSKLASAIESLSPDAPVVEFELDARHDDGSLFPAQLSIGHVSQRGGVIYTAIVNDLSEVKKAERLKREFVATVSHELRTPLTSIKGSLGLLKASILGDLSDQGRAMIEIGYKNCDRLVRLINDILDIEKIEAGKLDFDVESLDVGPEIARVIDETASYASERGVQVVTGTGPDGLCIKADPDRLAQVLTNLVSNAVKFSPSGETVSIDAARVSGRIRISVTDNGPGIEQDFQARIFQKFAQADASDTRREGGTGLGLNISKTIVEAHGGRIGFDTEPGSGTTFWIELPEAAARPMHDLAPKTSRILVCEDDPDIGQLLTVMIGDMGFDAELCATAAEARSKLSKGRYAAMTLDIGMPDQLGHDLMADLRADPRTEALPIIVVSARSPERQHEQRDNVVPIVDWLTKPIDTDHLDRSLRRATASIGSDPRRVLHVEDDTEHSAILAELLDPNVVCDTARTCAEARAMLEVTPYDLVILDLFLSDGDGECLLPAIAASTSPAPRVLIFSIAEPSREVRKLADCVLLKSRTSNIHLRETIETLLLQARPTREVAVFK